VSAEQTASAPARRRYSVAREGRGDDAKLVLDGGAGRSRAEIALRGANLFRWTLAQGERGQLDLIESPKKLADLAEDPWGRGTPVLAPFPNRVANAKFVWEGKTIELEPNFPGGHAIHGLVGPRRWEVETTEEEPDFAPRPARL
jgi:aldose 1-epimerase